jgi:hypothetical protein
LKLSTLIVAAAVLAIPAASSFAQSNQPVTRAEVKSQLVQIEQVDHSHELFSDSNASYPNNIQADEARVTAQNGTAAASFGGISDSASGSGAPVRPVSAADWHSMYDHS